MRSNNLADPERCVYEHHTRSAWKMLSQLVYEEIQRGRGTKGTGTLPNKNTF